MPRSSSFISDHFFFASLGTHPFDLIIIFSIVMLVCLFFIYKAGLDASREARELDLKHQEEKR